MKNIRLKYYFVSFKLPMPVGYEPQVTPRSPSLLLKWDWGFDYFHPFPLN